MYVGFDVGPITGARSGVGNYCYYLLKHLLQLEDDCSFKAFSAGLHKSELSDFRTLASYRHLPIPTRVLYRVWNALGVPKVDALLGGVDIYHATNFYLPPTGRARRVVTIHDLAFLALPQYSSPKIVGPFAKGVRKFCHESDAIMAYSESTKRDIIHYLEVDAAKVTVAPMAVDEDFRPMGRAQALAVLKERYGVEDSYLLFVSTLEPRKNLIGLLDSFHLISKEFPHKLVLVGGIGWNAAPIFERVAQHNLEDRVIHIGFVPHLELPAFYCGADAFVFPTHYEGFGLPLLEALTCGCPVVASSNSSVPEVTGEGALRSATQDPEEFAGLMRQVLTDDALRNKLSEAGRKHAAKFSWTSCASTTMSVYKSLAAC